MKVELNKRILNFEQLAEDALDGSDYESGQLEELARASTNQSRAFGRLIEHLVKKQLLNASAVKEILGIYEDIKFTKE